VKARDGKPGVAAIPDHTPKAQAPETVPYLQDSLESDIFPALPCRALIFRPFGAASQFRDEFYI
jgi:hypothetical protein